MDSALHHEASHTLELLAKVSSFSVALCCRTADPPAFVPPPDLEHNLGGGWF